jgi:hypothetical protein
MATKEYTTSTGHVLTISPLPIEFKRLLSKAVDIPDPPYYEVDVLGGEKEKVEHTIESLTVNSDREVWKSWEEYQDKLQKAKLELHRKKIKAITRKCVDVEMPEDNAWIEIQEEFGIEVPEDERLRKVHFIETECIGSYTDVHALIDAAEVLTRFDTEEYQDALNLFRDILPRDEESE